MLVWYLYSKKKLMPKTTEIPGDLMYPLLKEFSLLAKSPCDDHGALSGRYFNPDLTRNDTFCWRGYRSVNWTIRSNVDWFWICTSRMGRALAHTNKSGKTSRSFGSTCPCTTKSFVWSETNSRCQELTACPKIAVHSKIPRNRSSIFRFSIIPTFA